MSDDETATTYESRLRDLLEHRMESGRVLSERAEQVAAAKAQLEDAERDYALAFSDALAAGWTEAELRKVFKSLGVPVPTRPRRSKSTGVKAQPPVPKPPVVTALARRHDDTEVIDVITA
ncbi:hypothetical protein H9623_12900 [Oerskovia sp. Sa1BUA8]|uniref:Uncharacterized protein n=1 Tax=Oerskovia douganii TaxID=2762210 RepID=A0A9D5UAY8_9CELL|nr:hypothetical protein [Oerskovia douganii]MBE7701195.1 hypothetical protein [Oerskovia douganii]